MKCELRSCDHEHDGSFGSGRFCSRECANTREYTPEKAIDVYGRIAAKLRKPLRERFCKGCSEPLEYDGSRRTTCAKCRHIVAVKGGQKAGLVSHYGKHGTPRNIFDMSGRTLSKVIKRLQIGCSQCGWNKAACDLHHIQGHSIVDADNHSNLTYVCPNCHRLIHRGLIPRENIVTLAQHVGDRWKECYYG